LYVLVGGTVVEWSRILVGFGLMFKSHRDAIFSETVPINFIVSNPRKLHSVMVYICRFARFCSDPRIKDVTKRFSTYENFGSFLKIEFGYRGV